jgi:hypothetical protein
MESKCPEAVRELSALKAKELHVAEPKTVSRPVLQSQLLQMEKEDQEARVAILPSAGSNIPDNDPRLIRMEEVDAANLRNVKSIIRQYGFPTVSMVGWSGVRAAFLLVQHADTDAKFQASVLRIFEKRVLAGEIDADSYAKLTDRVLRAQGKPQKYGTQFEVRDGDWKPEPIGDEEHVEQRRKAIGLGSFENYSCTVHAIFGPAEKGG